MKIAFIGPRGFNYPAGIDRVSTELAKRLARRNHDITFYHRTETIKPSSNLVCRHIPTLATSYLETPVYAIGATFHALFQGFDVIHFHGLGSAWCIPIVRLFTSARIVATIHAPDWLGSRWNNIAKRVLKTSARITLKFSHVVTTVSQSNLQELSQLSDREIKIIANGIDIPTLRTPKKIISIGLSKDNYILFLGRLTPGKGCEYLIEAFSKLIQDKKLVIAGDTIHDHDYVKMLKEMSGPQVEFLGWVEGELKEELLSNAYLFVQPSDLEGLSGTLIEAMSYGLCIVASDIPSDIEVMEDSGLYFKQGMADDLKDILKQLLGDHNQIMLKGQLARERVSKHFAWGPIVDKFEDIYKSGT